jgi:hypothetical protein
VSCPTITRKILTHIGFLVSHLSPTSVSTFSAQLWGQNNPTPEYPIDFSLGFGPHICLQVSPFAPRDRQSLRSFQKKEGDNKLDVKDSLPIALNFFSIESTAEMLDAWLDVIVDSRSELSEYTNFMMERYAGSLSATVLQSVISWFLRIRNKVSSRLTVIIYFIILDPSSRTY